MEKWVPLVQVLVWPVLLIVFLFIARDKVFAVLDAIVIRIKKGDSFQAGPFGMGKSVPQDAYSADDLVKEGKNRKELDNIFSCGDYPYMPSEVQKVRSVRLVHEIGPWGKDKDGYTRRDIIVTLDTLPEAILEKIIRVTYYLPNSWPEKLRVQTRSDNSNNFRFKTRAYGEVSIGALVEFKDDIPPIVLNRYCNFYDRKFEEN